MSKTTSTWWCVTCQSEPMSHAAMRTHLTEHHKLDLKATKGTQQATMFLDGEGYSEQRFDVQIGPVVMTKHVLIEHEP